MEKLGVRLEGKGSACCLFIVKFSNFAVGETLVEG